MFRTIYLFFLLALLLLPGAEQAHAQGEVKAIMFMGILTGGKNSEPLVGASVSIPRAGRGILTNDVGYFALPVYPGDSVEFSHIGYKKQYHVIPRVNEPTYSRIIEMQEESTLLREVKVYPYPTEEDFKRAFLSSRLPDEKERENLARNTDPTYLKQMAARMGMGPAANARYFFDQQNTYIANRTAITTIPFLNPFAWASFIRSVKNGDLKRDDWKKTANLDPNQNINREQYIREQRKQ